MEKVVYGVWELFVEARSKKKEKEGKKREAKKGKKEGEKEKKGREKEGEKENGVPMVGTHQTKK